MWFWTDVPAAYESIAATPQNPSCPVFLKTSPKTSATGLLENCSLMTKKLTLPHLFSSCPTPFSFSFFVPALLHSVWDTTLCDFRKAQRYLPYFFMYLWLMGFSGWFWSWMYWQALECMVISDLELFSFKFLCAVAVKLECFIFGKVRCWRMSVCAYACVSVLLLLPACVRLNRSSSLPCFWKSGR